MKKMNNKGFLLAETITIAVVVIIALIVIYVQFVSVDNSYYKTFNYNNVNNLYLANNFKEFIIRDTPSIYDGIKKGDLYTDVTKCEDHFIEYMYCNRLIESINAKRVIIINNDTTSLIDKLNTTDFSETLKSYIRTSESKELGYRLIIEFNDNTVAGILIRSSEMYESYNVGDIVTLTSGNDKTSSFVVIENSSNFNSTVKLLKLTNIDSNKYAFDVENNRTSDKNSYCMYPNLGCDAYSANGDTVTEDSSIKQIVDNYGINLGLNTDLQNIRLINSEELYNLGCDVKAGGSCPNTYSWLTNASYWIINLEDNESVNHAWGLNSSGFAIKDPLTNNTYGIRPVLIVSKNIVKGG